jgi:hypothetical protein
MRPRHNCSGAATVADSKAVNLTTADSVTTHRDHSVVISSETRCATREASSQTATIHTPRPTNEQQPLTHITASLTSTTHNLSPALPLPTPHPDHPRIAKREGGRGFLWAPWGRAGELHTQTLNPGTKPGPKGGPPRRVLAGFSPGFWLGFKGFQAAAIQAGQPAVEAGRRPWGSAPNPGPARRSARTAGDLLTRSPVGMPHRSTGLRGMAKPARARRSPLTEPVTDKLCNCDMSRAVHRKNQRRVAQ